MACITSSDPVVETHGGYPDAVERVNEVVAFYREHVPSLPASFPSATQHQALVRLALGMDVSLSLKTGGGKTLDAVLAPWLVGQGVVSFVVPLDVLLQQHVETFVKFGYKRERIFVLHTNGDNLPALLELIADESIGGPPLIILAHPEPFVERFVPAMATCSATVRSKLTLLVIDEAQLILDWGDDFRPSYSRLKELRELTPKMRVLTLSGSTNRAEREAVCVNLDMPSNVVVSGCLGRRDLSLCGNSR